MDCSINVQAGGGVREVGKEKGGVMGLEEEMKVHVTLNMTTYDSLHTHNMIIILYTLV